MPRTRLTIHSTIFMSATGKPLRWRSRILHALHKRVGWACSSVHRTLRTYYRAGDAKIDAHFDAKDSRQTYILTVYVLEKARRLYNDNKKYCKSLHQFNPRKQVRSLFRLQQSLVKIERPSTQPYGGQEIMVFGIWSRKTIRFEDKFDRSISYFHLRILKLKWMQYGLLS